MANNILEEKRYWQLTYGSKYVTVYLTETKKVEIINLTLKEIFDEESMGIEEYLTLCAISGYKDNKELQELTGQEKELLDKQLIISYAIFLNKFVRCDNIQYHDEDNSFDLIFNEDNHVITLSEQELYKIIDEFRYIYCLSSKNKYFSDAKPITEEGQKMLEMFRIAKEKVESSKNGNVTIDSIILGVCSKIGSPYNLFNIWGLTIWQLFEVHSKLHKNDNIYFTNIGIYTGNIDVEKAKFKSSDLNWSCR